jgi:signal transduction histidine kinase/CheY-like chemotaxis protein
MRDARFKFMVLALVVCIAVLGTVTVSRTVFMGRVLISQALGRIEYDGSLAASKINGWLESQIGYLNGATEDLGWLMETSTVEELRPVIEAHYKNYGTTFFQMYFGFPDGTLWFPGEWKPPKDWRADEQPWYIGAARDPGGVFVSDPYQDTRTGSMCVAISRAIMRNGELAAVMGVDVYLGVIRDLVNETPIAEGMGSAFLVNGDSGLILIHPDPLMLPGENGRRRTIYNSFGGIYRELLNTADGESVFVAGFDGTRRYCNSQTIPAAGWKLFSLVDQNIIRAPIVRQTMVEIVLFTVVLLLICVLLFVTSRAMRHAVLTAKEHSDMKTTFLASMSHEIRTPMNGIIGFTELALGNSALADQTRDYLEKIRNSAMDLLTILNDVLDVSKIEAGKVVLEKIPFDLHDLIVACENTVSVKAAEKGINLYIYSEPFIEYKLLGDPTKLRQVLLNLLANAVKFTNAGTVKLMTTVEKAMADRLLLHFEVKDSGVGMTAAQMAGIFKPFEQADKSTTRKYGGTGLGLPISKNLVELMGGKLQVESAPGIGSKFSFTLEFELSGKKAGSREKEPLFPADARRPVFAGRVLICEDNTMNQDLLRDHLERLSLEMDIVENGELGLEAVRTSMEKGRPYDLIFMDIHMPVMDGLEAASEIKRLGYPNPIIALTANVLTQDTDIYYRYGMVDHLGKPFTSQELWDCLSKYLTPVTFVSPPSRITQRGSSPALDPQAGLKRAGGNRELYEKLRRDFYHLNRNFFESLLSLLAEGAAGNNAEAIVTAHRMVHNLKSSAALVGAEKLRAAAAAVEAPLKEGRADCGAERMEALRESLEAVLEELKREAESGV